MYLLCSQAHLLQNPTYLKEAGQTSVELILSWITLIKIGVTYSNLNGNVNFSMENFVNNMNDLLDKHSPFKKLSKYKLKFKTKPWIIVALQNLISIKNALKHTSN